MADRLLLVAVLALGLSACGDDRNRPVEDVARSFYAAVASDDGPAACELLAPATRDELEQASGKPCAEAILEEDVPEVGDAQEVQVYGTAGQVTYGADTAFLGKFGGGWRVVAVACTARGPRPHDCDVAGG